MPGIHCKCSINSSAVGTAMSCTVAMDRAARSPVNILPHTNKTDRSLPGGLSYNEWATLRAVIMAECVAAKNERRSMPRFKLSIRGTYYVVDTYIRGNKFHP